MPLFAGTDLGSGYYDAGTGGIQAPFVGPSAGNNYTAADLQKINQVLFGGTLTPTQMQYYTGQPNVWANLYQTPQAQAYLQEVMKTQGTQPRQLTPGGDPSTSFTNTSPNQAPVPAPGSTGGGGTTPTGTDLRSQLSAIFAQYGMDPNNPGYGLGNLDYFMQRAQQTNPNDTGYWTARLGQEIQQAKYGVTGNLIDTGSGQGGGLQGTYGSMPQNITINYQTPQVPKGPAFSYQPWTQQFQAPTGYQAWTPPTWDQQWTPPTWDKTFQAPTAADETNDPGYNERLAQGQQALQQSAAAQGTLLTTGTQKALERYGQDYASNEYQNVYNRALGQYQQDYQQYLNQYQQSGQQYQQAYQQFLNQFQQSGQQYQQGYQQYLNQYQQDLGAYQQNYQQYLNNYNQALQTYGTNANVSQQQFADAMSVYQTQAQLAQQQYQNAFQQYQQQYGEGQQAYQNQQAAVQQNYNNWLGLYNSGLQAAGSNNANLGNYGTNASNLYTGIGNVQAGSQLYGSNLYGSALSNMGNTAMNTAFLYGLGNSLYASPRSPSTTPYSNSTIPGVG